MLVDSTRDHGVYVTLAGAFFMSLSFLALALRLVSRWPWKDLFSADDTMAVVATIFSLIQGTIVLVAVDRGLGKVPQDLTPQAVTTCARLVYASDLVFMLTVYASNVSAAISLARFANLTKYRHRLYIKLLTVACGVTFVVSFILLAVQHGAPSPQLHHSAAAVRSTAVAWVIYVVLGGSLNLAIAIYPAYLVLHLQMPTRDKWKVGISYGLRMLLVPICALRINSLAKADRSNFPYGYAFTEIYTQAEMCYALISATVPCLRPFLVLAKTGLFDLSREGTFTHRAAGALKAEDSTSTMNSTSQFRLQIQREQRLRQERLANNPHAPTKQPLPRAGARLPPRRYRDDGGPERGRSQTVSSISAGRNLDELLNHHVDPGAIEIRQKIEIHRS